MTLINTFRRVALGLSLFWMVVGVYAEDMNDTSGPGVWGKESASQSGKSAQAGKVISADARAMEPGRVIVRFKTPPQNQKQSHDQVVAAKLEQLGVTRHKSHRFPRKGKGKDLLKQVDEVVIDVLQFPRQISAFRVVRELLDSGLVEYAQPDYILSINADPGDPDFGTLWGMHNTGQTGGTPDADIDAPEAWDFTTSSNGIVVGVIDTGVDYLHEDLAANMWVNPGETAGDGVDDDNNGYIDDIHGIDCINNDTDPMDNHYHGTHVAGTIGAVGGNTIGGTGVNWTTSIMALKFMNPVSGGGASGPTSDAIECLNYAVTMKTRAVNPVDIRLTSNSWGGGPYDPALYDAINAAGDAGLLFVAAAGNDGADNDATPYYPSNYDLSEVVSVAATNHDDLLSGFSNFGATRVDLGAPGSNIYSTLPNNQYGSASGTSMATPLVAGVAALLWGSDASLTVGGVKALLLNGGDAIPALNGKTVTGRRLNLYNSISCTAGTPVIGILEPGEGFSVLRNEDQIVKASFFDCGTPKLNATIDVTSSNGDAVFSLLDNGVAPDKTAGDGIYTGTWTPIDSGPTDLVVASAVDAVDDTVSGEVIAPVIYQVDKNHPYSWIDATGGTETSLAGNLDAYVQIPIGFEFKFYGETYSQLYVSTHGLVGFVESEGLWKWINDPIPTSEEPNAIIAPFWDDVSPQISGNVYYLLEGTAPNQIFTIQWDNVDTYGSTSDGGTFEVILYETSNEIVFQYQDIVFGDSIYDNGSSATVGIEHQLGGAGVAVSYNSSDVANEQAVIILPLDAIPLLINAEDPSEWGWKWGDNVHKDRVLFQFEGNGSDRYLHLTGYDVDFKDELRIYQNGMPIQYLATGQNNTLAAPQVVILPESEQLSGTNLVEIRQRTSGYKWGVTKAGLYDDPGGIPLLINAEDPSEWGWKWGDKVHKDRILFQFEGNGSDRYLHLTGYDVDFEDELRIYLNGMPIQYLATGPNNTLAAPQVVILPESEQLSGTNLVEIRQRTSGYKWGASNVGLYDSP